MTAVKKLLIVANVAKEHIIKFHIPTIKMLKAGGWTVHVACGGDEKIPYCDRQFHLPCDRNPYKIATFKSVQILKRIIQAENYDIIHCHTATGGLIARAAAAGERKHGLKVLYTAHGLHFYKGASYKKWLFYFPVEWLFSYFTDLVLTMNEEDYCNAQKYLRAKQVQKINGVGVDLERFYQSKSIAVRAATRNALGIDHDTTILVYVAELCANKNQGSLIHMVNHLKDRIPNCCLLLIGPDYNNGEFQALVNKLSLEESVKFLGWRNDVPALLVAADYAVASSIREGLPLNIIESMACGLPVIAFDNRGHREIIEDGISGFLIHHGHIQQMADTIVRLHDDEKLKQRIVENGYKTIRKYEQKDVLVMLQQIYQTYH